MPGRSSIAGRLAVLQNVPFRRLLAGRAISFLGDGLYTVAAMWLVYELTGSTAYTGLAGFLSRAPTALKVFGGPLVDRADVGRVLVGSELLGALLALIVPVAAVTGHLSVTLVLAIMPLMALTELFAAPAQTASLPRVVDADALVRANSAFSVVTNVVTAGARALAGALVAALGAVSLYALDAGTYLLAAATFATLSIPGTDREPEPLDLDSYRRDLREGFDVLVGSVVGLMLAASLAANFLTSAAFAVLPAFAADIGGARTYGLLLAATTAGTVVGSMLAPAVERLPLGWTNVVGLVLAGGCWVAGVRVPGVLFTVVLFAASRVPIGVYNVSVQATLQTGVPDDRLGRVTATISSLSNVVGPVGLLVGGVAGDLVGARLVLVAGGVGLGATALIWLLSPTLRRFGPPTAVRPGSFG